MKNRLIFLSLLLITILFGSCKNFMQGKDFVEQLDEIIWLSGKEQPTAKIISPVSAPNGDYRNASLIIKFSQPMDPETFEEGFSVTNNTGDSLRDYYNEAVWDEEGSQVTLTAKETNLLPIASGTFMDITLTIKCSIKNKDKVPLADRVVETYKLNSTVDKEAPTFVNCRAAIDWDIFYEEVTDEEGNVIVNPKLFVEGEITDENQDELLTKNHFASSYCILVTAHDYGDNKVFANTTKTRVFDIEGNAVTEDSLTQSQELKYLDEDTLDSEDGIYIDLWGNTYKDGIYKVEIKLSDAANNISEETKVFYAVRDTAFYLDSYSKIYTWIPSWREENPGTTEPQTLNNIEKYSKGFNLENYSDDIYVTYKGKKYSTNMKDFSFTFSYGLSADDPNMVKDFDISDSIWIGDDNILYCSFPEDFLTFQKNNHSKNIYGILKTSDAVGNSRSREFYFPRQPKTFGYTYNNATNTVTLNFEDKSSILDKDIQLRNITTQAQYRIMYAQKDASKSIEETPLTRNFLKSYTDDQWDLVTGKIDFKIDPTKQYFAVIIPIYYYTYNYYFCSKTYGVPVVIDNISSSTSGTPPASPTISNLTVTTPKDSSGKSNVKITANLPNENGVTYYYGWSEDGGTTWSYFAEPEFTVPTLIKPPVTTTWYNYEEKANDSDPDKDWDTFKKNVMEKCYVDEYETKGYAAVFANNGHNTSQSSLAEHIFKSKEDDNIPPKVDEWVKNHNLTMSADGKFFISSSIVRDEEWNDATTELYHYTPYLSSWGDNVNFYTTEEIHMLPWTFAQNETYVWKNTTDNCVERSITYHIPVNGLSDGQYMFFYNYNDTCGNNATGTMGKVSIATYKNKPKLSFDKTTKSLTASIDVSGNEMLEFNKVFMQAIDANGSKAWTNTASKHINNDGSGSWYDETDNSIYQTIADTRDMTVSGTSLVYTERDVLQNSVINEGTFYKATVTGYNWDKTTGWSIYKKHNGNNWYDAYLKHDGTVAGYNDSNYDMCTDEIASIPAYIYVGSYNNNEETIMETQSGQIYSKIPVLVQVYSSIVDLGNNINEWERRGNLVSVNAFRELPFPKDNPVAPYDSYNKQNALDEICKEPWLKNHYYVIIARFANGSVTISSVYHITNGWEEQW